MRILLVASLFALISCSSTSTSREPVVFKRADGVRLTASSIDATTHRLMKAANVPGLALALIDDSGIKYLKTYGFASIDKDLPLQTDTIMYGASLTKGAFAYLVMTLVDEQLVDLDKPIHKYLPKPLTEYENYADLQGDSRWRVWTLRSLLSHTAGLPNRRWFSDDKKLEILFEPGSRYAYSGEGIQVAQFVLEEGLGLDVNQLMQERVFDRFNMPRTSMLWRDDFRPNFARGYSESNENLGHNMRQSVRAAGSMDTTISDFASFLAGVLQGTGISKKARSEMLGPQVAVTARHQFPTQFPVDTDVNRDIALSYGLGWGVFESNFGRAWFKEGHDDGTNNYALCLDESGRCILILSNSSNGESMFLYLVNELIGETGLPWEWEGYRPYDLEE